MCFDCVSMLPLCSQIIILFVVSGPFQQENNYFHYSTFSEFFSTFNYLKWSPKVLTTNASYKWQHSRSHPLVYHLFTYDDSEGQGSTRPCSIEGCWGFTPLNLSFIGNSCVHSSTSPSSDWLWGWESGNSFFSLLSVSVL